MFVGMCMHQKVLIAKVVPSEDKVFCVPQFAKIESVVKVQCAFWIKFRRDSPSDDNIPRRYHQAAFGKGKVQGNQEFLKRMLSE